VFGLSGAEWNEKEPRLAYSPDLASSDFYLFGRVKQILAGHEFPGGGALLDAVQDILRGIEMVTLDQSFLVWMERLERYVPINGDYVQ
jgi:hypothetical protein